MALLTTSLRKVVRSPHLLEVFASYGSVACLLSFMCVHGFGMSWLRLLSLFCGGVIIYTFLEYWFHRFFLHEVLSKAHNNHHEKPRNLRIIATPIIPVQLYDFAVVLLLIQLVGRETAYGLNTGIAIGQCIMDTVHILFHSKYRPWFLESARSYHLYHHFVDDDLAHGLTTSFWDLIFGTFPNTWYYYKKYPWLKYLQLPFPLATFVLIGLMSGDTTKVQKDLDVSRPLKHKTDHGIPRTGYVVTTFCTAMMVVCGWEAL